MTWRIIHTSIVFDERLLKEPIYTHWDQMISSPPSYINVSTQQKFFLRIHCYSISIYAYSLYKTYFYLRQARKIYHMILFIFFLYTIKLTWAVRMTMMITIFIKVLTDTSNTKTFCSQKTTDYMSTYIPIYISEKRNL